MFVKMTDDELSDAILGITDYAKEKDLNVLREAARRILVQKTRLDQFRKERDILKVMINGMRSRDGYAQEFLCPVCMHLNENMGTELSPCMDCLREPLHPGFRSASPAAPREVGQHG